MPNEYEIVTSKLLLNTEEGFTRKRFELDVPLRQWYERYQHVLDTAEALGGLLLEEDDEEDE